MFTLMVLTLMMLILLMPKMNLTIPSPSIRACGQVKTAVVTQIVLYSCLIVIALFMLWPTVRFIVTGVIEPLQALKAICQRIVDDDLTRSVPTEYSSADMQVRGFRFWCVTLISTNDRVAHSSDIVTGVIEPLQELKAICQRIVDDDLTRSVPSEYSSADMQVLWSIAAYDAHRTTCPRASRAPHSMRSFPETR
jgi:hypothetical protein